MKEYTYYFFDLFHTLIKVEPYHDKQQREHTILGITQKEWSSYAESDYTNRALGLLKKPDQVVETIFSHMNISITKDQADKVKEIRKKRFEKAFIDVDTSILNTIKTLKGNRKVIVLVSNADVFDKMYWEISPLYRYFDKAIFSCDVGVMKPNEAIYTIAKNSVNADIEKSVYVGDGGHNELVGAKSIGLNTILTTEIIESYWPEEIPELTKSADHVIRHLSELVLL